LKANKIKEKEMDIYGMTVSDLPQNLKSKIEVLPDGDSLNKKIANEFCDLLEAKQAKNEMLTVICPVGPLDYSYFAAEVKKRGLSCNNLRTINMDEYLDDNDQNIPETHPLSFRRFMNEGFFFNLDEKDRPAPENIIFPDPDAPEKVTELIDSIGGADICWAGFGITGHVAFNDPPQMTGEPEDLDSFRNCKTRKVTICPMATAQMAMGGTNGNLEILPTRAITVGMYEMLKSKKFHLTFMRNWHAGLWRRALLGPVTSEFPGSLLQEHGNLEVTMTEHAAAPPLVNTAQATGEEK
jgi:glucosamine-6-phosphate deaminase